ncbi:MAG: TnpV protein [Bacilli bacterium]|nr:TnpV protein [Bacilli bacterium]
MEIKYTRQGDYLIPNLYLEKDDNCGRIGKYGILRLHFIAQNKQALYETLLMTNKLTHHLLLVSDSCESLYKILMEDYIKNDERLSEKSKELYPLEWTKLMNNYKNMAEEIVLNEYVFV